MNEQNGDRREFNATAEYAQLKRRLRGLTREEILEELSEKFEEEEITGEPVDPRLVLAYTDILDELHTEEPGDNRRIELTWTGFKRNHPELFSEKAPRTAQPHRRPRSAQIARVLEVAVIAAALLIVTATAFRWPDYLVAWGREAFSFGPIRTESGVMEMETLNASDYLSLGDAVRAYSLERVAPTWIPREFALANVRIQEFGSVTNIIALYSGNDADDIVVRISSYEDEADMPDMNMEKDQQQSREIYIVDGISHEISQNYDRSQVIWKNGRCICSITGNITETQLKEMVNSIYI